MIELERSGGRSRLELGRMVAGEIPREESEGLSAYEAELAEEELPPFDFVALTAAAQRIEEPAPAPSRPPPWRGWLALLVPLAVAALALFAIRPPDPGVRTKGEVDLAFFVEQDGQVRPGIEGEVLAPGDAVQLSYRADGHDTLVVLNVDGTGRVTVFFPEEGAEPGEVLPGGRQLLDFSVVLDEAPGPELFVGVFGVGGVDEAVELVERAFAEGGHAAVEALTASDPAVDVVRVEKAR